MGVKRLNLTLLYVEDDEVTRKSIGKILALKVSNLYVAKDGVEALEIFKRNNIHLVISDYRMPRMDGNKLCENIKQINPSIPFVLLTAYNDTDLLVNAIDVGVDKFLQKPIKAKKLFTVLQNVYKRIVKDFELEKATICLKEAEKIAKLAYWGVEIDDKKITFSGEAKELFHIRGEDYNDFSICVKEEDRSRFLKIFQERVYLDEPIDEIIAIEDAHKNIAYI